MTQKSRILIVNDDGIHAPGIYHLWKALDGKADLSIIAPAFEQSGMSTAVTLRSPLHIETVEWPNQTPAWKVTGTPTDCVRFASTIIADYKPDLIVSGINRGDNAGRNVLFSGTVGCVIEAVMRGIPGIAFSCEKYIAPDYESAEKHIYPIVQYVLNNPLPKGTFLNVTFPSTEGEIKGFKLARQGKRYWNENPHKGTHPEGHHYYWHGGKLIELEEEETSDISYLKQGYLTATPIHVEELTDHAYLSSGKNAFEQLFTLQDSLR